MSDLIDRQDAIELINEYLTAATLIKNKDMVDALEDMKDDFVNLQSAQPEIITCEHCKYWDGNQPICDGRRLCVIHGTYMYYCSDAERREDE